MHGLREWNKKSLYANTCRLLLSSTAYNLCPNRNEIKHGSHPKTEEQILQRLFWEVRTRVVVKGRFKKCSENVAICRNWGINVEVVLM
jgi:hypothetical protein